MMALGVAVFVYTSVPAGVERVTALRWRAGSPPAPIEIVVSREGARLMVASPVSSEIVLVFQRGDGSYLIDGPITSAGESARRLDDVWRRSVEGDVAGDLEGAAIEWLPSSGAPGEAWPACWWRGSQRWECMGVPLSASGVAIAAAGSHIWSAAVTARSAGPLRASSWGRLVIVSDRGEGAPPRVTVTTARPVTPAQRTKAVRVESATVGDVTVTRIDPAAVWIAGDSSPPAAWIEVRSARSGPSYVPLADVADGPPQVPIRVLLENPRTVEATILSDRGEPAAGALVTAFRVIDPPPAVRSRDDPPPRRVFATESVADADGRVHLDRLGDAPYEIVAWHSQLGRASQALASDTEHLTVRLVAPAVARGRVLVGGKPVQGIGVTTVPDLGAFALAADPIDVTGGDTRTGPDGRFVVALAAGGGGEVRVGGGTYGVKRVPLPRAPLPIVDLGDIELGRALVVSVTLDQDPGCDLRATGPVGRSGLQIVPGVRTGPGLFRVSLPEEGSWEFVLICGREERALTPSIARVTDQTPPGLTFVVR